jgi:hypothetical protein
LNLEILNFDLLSHVSRAFTFQVRLKSRNGTFSLMIDLVKLRDLVLVLLNFLILWQLGRSRILKPSCANLDVYILISAILKASFVRIIPKHVVNDFIVEILRETLVVSLPVSSLMLSILSPPIFHL